MNSKQYYVYIATNKRNNVFYVGVTKSLIKRQGEHGEKKYANSFTSKYNINKIVYYEIYGNINAAIYREKQIKNWHREWKINTIEKENSMY